MKTKVPITSQATPVTIAKGASALVCCWCKVEAFLRGEAELKPAFGFGQVLADVFKVVTEVTRKRAA